MAESPSAGRFETQVQRRLLGGLFFGLFLSALSLIVLQNMTRWAVRERERAVVAQTQAILEHVSAQPDAAAALTEDRATARLLWAFPARWAALYGEAGARIAQASTLSAAALSPGRDVGPWPPAGDVSLVDATGAEPPSLIVRGTLVSGRKFLVVAFDGEPVVWARRTVMGLAWFLVAAAATLVVLGLLFLRRLLRPIEALTEAARDAGEVVPLSSTPFERWARDEMDHAVQTFTRTIHELRKSSAELDVLRRREKERADVLEVTASTLVRSHPGGLLVVAEDGRLSELNENARLLLGVPKGAEGRPAREVFESVPELVEALARASRGEPSLAIELSTAGAEGSRALAVTAVPIAESEGKALGTIAFLEDRTDTNRLQRELSTRRELAALGEMSAGIAHEFRNATATILGYARLAATSEDPTARARHLAGVSSEARHIAKVTGDFLLFARPERLERSHVDLAALVAEVVEEERLLSPAVVLGATGVFQPALVDAALFRRALVNLLRNAAEAPRPAGREGRVLVRGLEGDDGAEGFVKISVEDDGEGVPETEAAKIFVPFYSTRASGTGLGLALVAKIMALHGGTVSVERSAELLGARFVLTLPRTSLEESSLPAVTRSGIRITPIR
ncbi:MAG: PAS domain-containing protein [Acidobacteria bacterium]|nr:PAS domain-containing protein [Acidobacteriota bacterium]